MDLTPFCSKDKVRFYLLAPWTRAGHMFASDGTVMVRVPARAGVAEQKLAPDAGQLFQRYGVAGHRPAPAIVLPALNERACEECSGAGKFEDWGDCFCCDGVGRVDDDIQVGWSFGGVAYSQHYIRLIWALPELRLPTAFPKHRPMHFLFAGGDGLVMPLRANLSDTWRINEAKMEAEQ